MVNPEIDNPSDKFIDLLEKINDEFEDIESFVEADSAKSEKFKQYLKSIYDFIKLNDNQDSSSNYSKSNSKKLSKSKVVSSSSQLTELPELIIDKNLVDSEQIYQQLQLFNTSQDASSSINSLTKFFSRSLVNSDSISFNLDVKSTLKGKSITNGINGSNNSNSPTDINSNDDADQSEDEDEDEDDDFSEGEEDEVDRLIKESKLNGNKKEKNKNNSNVNNFGIPDGSDSEISDFDVNENAQIGEEDDEEEEEDEEIDEEDDAELGKEDEDDIDSDELDDDLVDMYNDLGDEKEVMELGKPMKAFDEIDFDREDFDLLDLDDKETNMKQKSKKEINENINNNKKEQKKPKDLFHIDESDEEDKSNENKSSFELRQEKLKQQIDQVHESMLNGINDKEWQLKGEITAKTRPQDSLLEEYLDFDHTTRQKPVTSTETTADLEKMIKQRIKDKAFDDVERKIKPVEMKYEFRKQVALDHEKSKLGLSEVYEQDYLKQQEKQVLGETGAQVGNDTNALPNKKHDEIRKMMQSLFIKLDALSNFHFTPKAPLPEVKIVSNMPTISMEEVAPVSVADSNVLAPEEIKENIKSLPKSKSEEDKKDKKRKLRTKKAEIKKAKVKKEKKLQMAQALDPDNVKISKEVAMNKLKKQAKNMSHNIKILKDDKKSKVNSALRSSSAFFKQLQENTQLSKKVGKKKLNNSDSNAKSSKKLKL